MKAILIIMLVSLCLFGCATPLDPQRDSERIGTALGIPAGDVRFTSYCIFDEARKWPRPQFTWNEGAVIATDRKLYITSERLTKETGKARIELSFSEMSSIGEARYGLGRQLQLIHGDYIVILQITGNKMFGSSEGSKKLLEFIASKGVRITTTETF